MEIDIQAKRAEAKKYKGVSYDVSRGQFMAQIQRGKDRKTLGRYDTAKEASEVYEAERKASPIKRQAKGPSYRLPRKEDPKADNSIVRFADDLALWLGQVNEEMPLGTFCQALWANIFKECTFEGETRIYGGLTFEVMCRRVRRDSWRAKNFNIRKGVVGFVDPETEEEVVEPEDEEVKAQT